MNSFSQTLRQAMPTSSMVFGRRLGGNDPSIDLDERRRRLDEMASPERNVMDEEDVAPFAQDFIDLDDAPLDVQEDVRLGKTSPEQAAIQEAVRRKLFHASGATIHAEAFILQDRGKPHNCNAVRFIHSSQISSCFRH